MKKIVLCSLIIFCLIGCVSKRDLGGIATVSALVVAVPLVPFVEAYHVINDSDGKMKAQSKAWRTQFDPVYLQRTQLLSERNAKLDALYVYKNTGEAYIPSVYEGDILFGVIYWKQKINAPQNQQIILKSPLLADIQQLVYDDPTHVKVAGYKYHSDAYDCFTIEKIKYMVAFNQAMSSHTKRYSMDNNVPIGNITCRLELDGKDQSNPE